MLRKAKALARTASDALLAELVRRGASPRAGSLTILTYHRVMPVSSPAYERIEPGMRIDPQTFEAHLRELKRQFVPIHLSAWLDLRRQGKAGSHRYVAVVFDDGWRDNYEHAFGPLKTEAFPACIFLVVHAVDQKVRFWADAVADLYFSDQRLGALARLAALLPRFPASRDVLEQEPNAEGLARLIAGLKANRDAEVEAALGRLMSEDFDAAACLRRADDREFLNWDEVGRMAESGLIEFGSHTMTHQRLDSIDDEGRLCSEVVASHDELRARLGSRFNAIFCYPNGSIGAQGAALVREHYRAACTTRRGVNGRDADVYGLARINIHRDIASTASSLLARLY